jgi:hypothetical protein
VLVLARLHRRDRADDVPSSVSPGGLVALTAYRRSVLDLERGVGRARARGRIPSTCSTPNIFYSTSWTLAYSEANFGAGILAIPAYWATRNPYVANTNSATLLSLS